jgi:NADH-quinone oxidoreductase subunit M
MIPVLLILVPLVCGVITFFIKTERSIKTWALVSSLATLVVTLLGFSVLNADDFLFAEADWMPMIGSSFSVGLDGMGKILSLLTAIAFPVIFITTWHQSYKKHTNFLD